MNEGVPHVRRAVQFIKESWFEVWFLYSIDTALQKPRALSVNFIYKDLIGRLHVSDNGFRFTEINDIGVFFRELLKAMETHGVLERMSVPPAVAISHEKFHRHYYRKFSKGCTPVWGDMTLQQKGAHLRAFILNKFSLDPNKRCLLPTPGNARKRCCDARWPDFWLTDKEADTLVTETLNAYQEYF